MCKLWKNIQSLRKEIIITEYFDQYIHNINHNYVLNIKVHEYKITDEELMPLLMYKNLEHLEFIGSHISRLQNLQYLNIGHNQLITDIGLIYIYV